MLYIVYYFSVYPQFVKKKKKKKKSRKKKKKKNTKKKKNKGQPCELIEFK